MNGIDIVHHPFAFSIGPVEITGFGLAVLLAFVLSQIIAQRELARRGHLLEAEAIPELILAAVIGTIVGGKLYYAVLTGDPSTLISREGLVFWGGFIGAVVAVLFTMRWRKLPILRIADVAGICIAAGYAVGRTGCWAVGDDYGRPWDSPLAVSFPEGIPPSTALVMNREFGVPIPPGVAPDAVLAVHPTQLYETAMGVAMFAILWRFRDHEHAAGWLFGLYCVLAGVERFVVEIFRAKDDRFFFDMFTMAQAIAILVFFVGAGLMVGLWRTAPGRPGVHAENARPSPA